jgi:hypothetical protein
VSPPTSLEWQPIHHSSRQNLYLTGVASEHTENTSQSRRNNKQTVVSSRRAEKQPWSWYKPDLNCNGRSTNHCVLICRKGERWPCSEIVKPKRNLVRQTRWAPCLILWGSLGDIWICLERPLLERKFVRRMVSLGAIIWRLPSGALEFRPLLIVSKCVAIRFWTEVPLESLWIKWRILTTNLLYPHTHTIKSLSQWIWLNPMHTVVKTARSKAPALSFHTYIQTHTHTHTHTQCDN